MQKNEGFGDIEYKILVGNITKDSEELLASFVQIAEIIEGMAKSDDKGTGRMHKMPQSRSEEVTNKSKQALDFSVDLERHNVKFAKLWNSIERNTLEMLAYIRINKNEKNETIRELMGSFQAFLNGVNEMAEGAKQLRKIVYESMGINIAITLAYRVLANNLSVLLFLLEQTAASIGSILKEGATVAEALE